MPISVFGRRHKIDTSPLSKVKSRWWERANCKGLLPEDASRIFFPVKQHAPLTETYAEAHEYCKNCEVKTECLNSAIDEEGRRAYGYRGDADHLSRRRMYYDRKHKGELSPNYAANDGVQIRRKAHERFQAAERQHNGNGKVDE